MAMAKNTIAVNPLSVDPPQGSYDEQQSTSTSGATEDDEVNDDTCVFITWYSRQLAKLPVAIGMIIGVLALTGICSVVAFLFYNIPDFGDPTKGFRARGTDLSARIVSHRNLLGGNPGPNQLSSGIYVGNMSDDRMAFRDATNDGFGRKRRNVDTVQEGGTSGIQFCQDSDRFEGVVFGLVGGGKDMFTRQSLISTCTVYETHIDKFIYAQCCFYKDNGECANSRSLGNYVALMNNRSSCLDIRESDVTRVQHLLTDCAPHYLDESLHKCKYDGECPTSVPAECTAYNHAVYLIFHYLVPSDFSKNAKLGNYDLSMTIVALPVWWVSVDLYKTMFQNKHVSDGMTAVVALGFDLKFSLFAEFLLSDTLYIGLGAGLVVLIIWVYTGSLFITFITVLGMLMSLLIAYFAFLVLFSLPFFPFVNVASAVLIIGIGADDTFVYYDIWCQTKNAHPLAHTKTILKKTLQHASLTMLVTSLTTSSALYSSIVSSITAVRCFGVYSGTAIIVNFILTVTWLPAAVVIYSRFQDWTSTSNCRCPSGVKKLVSVHTMLSDAWRGFFEHYLPTIVIKLRFVWIVVFASLGVGAFCVVFISPRLQLPNRAEFQVFRDTDLFELYDNEYKPKFDFNVERKNPLYLALVFGVRDEDNGDHWDPDNNGMLNLEPNFNMSHPDVQIWLQDLCQSLKNQSFYNPDEGSLCAMMDMIKLVLSFPCIDATTPCCGQTSFPYPSQLFETCLTTAAECDTPRCLYGYVSPGPLFSRDGSIKALYMRDSSSIENSMNFNYIDTFWTEANSWFDERLESKPVGLTGGWLVAGSEDGTQLYFFNLQKSLATGAPLSMGLSLLFAAVMLILTTWNILISLYAMLSIAGTFSVTVGTLVLLGWRLNIFESAILSLAVGLSVDFTIHYGVAYRLAPSKLRLERTLHSLRSVGSAITVAALSTFAAGAMMMPSTVITYVQLGTFLMLVMTISWVYATFFFLSVCRVIGPQGNFAQIPIHRLFCRKKPIVQQAAVNSQSHELHENENSMANGRFTGNPSSGIDEGSQTNMT
ncbi:protein dispatched homolog 1-like [Asterias rubens]|uniref:protein dispatched homolog 1-like n=1 Tax=Asterias rubens TaxID=7604 RepID=UPI0014554074|nr:protein dispatched homolog 1-like [Asterias rubens]XP_033628070.1 protein dispatched homolog 1-like [Asterias rubens]